MSFRSVFSFAVILVACLIISGECVKYKLENARHTIHGGSRNTSQRIYYSERVLRTSQFMRVVKVDLIYPPVNYHKKMIITYFVLRDNYLNGYGGYAFHTSGGVGFNHVGFHLESKRNHGFEFSVKINGKFEK